MSSTTAPSAWWQACTSTDTPSAGRCWWGWGTVDALQAAMGGAGPEAMALPPPTVAEAALAPPRLALASLPAALQAFCTDSKFERLLHGGGRDFLDLLRNIHMTSGAQHGSTGAVDLVAFPRCEEDVAALLEYCSRERVACIPFGGGSSVCQGVDPPSPDCMAAARLRAVISLDTRRLDGVAAVDGRSMCVRVGAGIFGPALEARLKRSGLTLRHYPQSFEFSTVGGWAATRSGGHFATRWTHIDDLLQGLRLVTPAGTTVAQEVPASGAGPAQHRLYVGSEGILGVITEASLRVRRRPQLRASAVLLFPAGGDAARSFLRGAEAVRAVVQSGLEPANLRLVDGPELFRMTAEPATETTSALLVGFESAEADAEREMSAAMDRTLAICGARGGLLEGSSGAPASRAAARARTRPRPSAAGERGGVAGKWGTAFTQGGYLLSVAAVQGMLLNTFETCISWARFPAFHQDVVARVRAAARAACGGAEAEVTCRLTHVYPDGPAPYYTVIVPAPRPAPAPGADRRAAQWVAIKAEASRVMAAHGAASTHHHAVGKLHRPHYERERGALFGAALHALKHAHDPSMILNPDVLIQTTGGPVTSSSELGGAMIDPNKALLQGGNNIGSALKVSRL